MSFTSVMVLPLLIVVAAGIYYIYNEVIHFMSKSLVRNKVVVITDAVSGMGAECARLLHQAGARLILCGTSWDKLESLNDSLMSGADPRETFAPKLVILDFSDTDSMPDVLQEVLQCYGYVDVLVCNSSMKLKAAVQSISFEVDRNIMDVNYFGPSDLARGVLPTMISRRSGHIILVNSIHGKLAVPFRSSYAASKHAAQAFFDCLRAEVEEYGIVVSTISHTFISGSEPPAPSSNQPAMPTNQPALPTDQPAMPTNQPALPTDQPAMPTNQPAPKPFTLAAFKLMAMNAIADMLTHGVSSSVLANEIVQTVNRKRKEVLLAHPIPRVALYLRTLFPPFLFAVLAAGVKDSVLAEQLQ